MSALRHEQRDALVSWGASIRGAKAWRVTLSGRTVTEGSPFDVDVMVQAIEQASSLAGSTVRTFVVLALDAAQKGDELARCEVRVDPRELARIKSDEDKAATQHIAATASALVATDHRAVAKAFEANSTALGESHSALIGMVKAFGDAGAAMMKGNAAIVEALEARAARDASTIIALEQRARDAEKRAQVFEDMTEQAIKEAERLKGEQRDLILLLRASFGDRVDEALANLGRSVVPKEVPS